MTDVEIIAAFGGAAKLSRELGIKPPALAYWKRKGIPKLRRIQLQSMRPELFANETNVQTVQPQVAAESA
jgi:hypothetical protein